MSPKGDFPVICRLKGICEVSNARFETTQFAVVDLVSLHVFLSKLTDLKTSEGRMK